MFDSAKGRSPIFWVVILLLVGVVGVVGVVGYYSYRGYKAMQRRKAMMKDVLPTFKEPDPRGTRAVTTKAFGLHIGFSDLTATKAFLKQRSISCKDTSIRALMKRYRMKKLAELKKKGPDAVSKASLLNYRSKRERNPQVRMSCERSSSTIFKDGIKRPDVKGRFLLIMDSPKHPLRHISYSYNAKHPTGIIALRDLRDAYTKKYGKAQKSDGKFPDLSASHPKDAILLKKYHSISYRWSFSDLRIYLKVMSLGKWVSVLEEVEVPLGIRPDAPAMKRATTPARVPATAPVKKAPVKVPARVPTSPR